MKHLTLAAYFRVLDSYTNGMGSFLDVGWVVLALGVSLGWVQSYVKLNVG